ncbi:MAG TPA: TlpA disulfide reductase family protein [Chloroflexia bacterium]|nr:TlpA disulfide reductase family protein [Chloroflexia bacterium]
MSKHIDPKTGRPAASPQARRSGGAETPVANGRAGGASGKVVVAPAKASPRVSQPIAPPKKTGFRTMDIALVLLGLLGVAALAWAITSNSQPAATGTGSSSAQATAAAVNAGAPEPPTATPLPMGIVASDFSLPDTEGNTVKLSDFRGKTVLLEFMAPWCPHCQDDAPILNSLYENYKDKNVQFLSVSATPYNRNRDGPIAMDDMVWFKSTYKVPFPMLFDKDAAVGRDHYSLQVFPTVYVIDANGQVRDQPPTPLSAEQLTAALDKVIK